MNCFAFQIDGPSKLLFAKSTVLKHGFVVFLKELATHVENVSIRAHRYFFCAKEIPLSKTSHRNHVTFYSHLHVFYKKPSSRPSSKSFST